MRVLITGVLLTAISWKLSRAGIAGVSEYMFFPLWLGFILTAEGLSEYFYKDSLMRRKYFSWLFLASIPLWWFFEFMNIFVQNWSYLSTRELSYGPYVIISSLYFSTVIPAVLSVAFLVYRMLPRLNGGRIKLPSDTALIVIGVLSLAAIVAVPKFAYPLVWIAPFLILDALNDRLGYHSLIREQRQGKWRLTVAIGIGALITGFFWEMWNFYSMPKWIYMVPYLDFAKVFEMPLLGYLGYSPFGLALFAFTVFAFSVARRFYKRMPVPSIT